MQFPLRICKHPKTPSFALPGKENDAVTLSDIDEFLFENFRSLYQKEYEEDTSKKKNNNNEAKTASFALESPKLLEPPPPENLCSSARFFVSSGSSSSLITDEACSSSASASASAANGSPATSEDADRGEDEAEAPDDFIALLTYSPSPYEDFRRSMAEMVEARVEHNGKVDWGFMEELLFCYLDLNNKKAYRYILRAFVDLIVVLRENDGRVPASRPPWSGGGRGGAEWRKLKSEM
ncbi:hypothetical protein BUALT_Bualt07G0140800 [Buddleja alternifolia]|uniref:Transcription repressor n=1 Tax=Buddleja alternifolia TaxID=168488 RepID=A0AAV6XBY2_9LAMI|nr:hypothetical protein BUALT_Bualt07G0140800 [Buddleja alternifolia]